MSKIRTGFVSNSSSSSFILAIKDYKKPEIVAPKWMVAILDSLVNRMFECDSSSLNSTEQLNEWFIDQYGWRGATLEEVLKDEITLTAIYNDIQKALDNGYIVKEFNIDYGSTGENFFNNMPNEDDGSGIYKIYGEGG